MTRSRKENEHEEDETPKYSRWVYDTPKRSEDSRSDTARDPEFSGAIVTPPPIARVKKTARKCSLQPAYLQRNAMKIFVPCAEKNDSTKYHCDTLQSVYWLSFNRDSDEEEQEENKNGEVVNLEPMPTLTPREEKQMPPKKSNSRLCRQLF